MQSSEFYHDLFADLTSDELTEVVAREMRERHCTGIIVCIDNTTSHVHSATLLHPDWDEMRTMSLADQLLMFAAYVSRAREVQRKLNPEVVAGRKPS